MAEPGITGDGSLVAGDLTTNLSEADLYLSQSTELLIQSAVSQEDIIQFSRFLKEIAQPNQEMFAMPIGFVRDNRSINYVETPGKDRVKFRLPYPSGEELEELVNAINLESQSNTSTILTPEYTLFADPDQGTPISLVAGEISSEGPIEETINKIKQISEVSGKIIILGSVCELLVLTTGKKVACNTTLVIHPDGRIIPRRKVPIGNSDLFEYDEEQSKWKQLDLGSSFSKAISERQMPEKSDSISLEALEIASLISDTIQPVREGDTSWLGIVVCWERNQDAVYRSQIENRSITTWLCPMSEGGNRLDENQKPIKEGLENSRIVLFFEAQNIYNRVVSQRAALNQPPTTEDTTICVTNEKRGRGATVVFNPQGEVVRAIII